jgi:hypothetical protein
MEDRKNQLVFSQKQVWFVAIGIIKKKQIKTSLDACCIQTLSEKIRTQRGIVDYCNLQLTKVLGIWEYSQWSRKCTQQPWCLGITSCHL